MSPKSRADYFKERRKSTKSFYVEIDSSMMEALEAKLGGKKTKKEWLIEKIKEEIGE